MSLPVLLGGQVLGIERSSLVLGLLVRAGDVLFKLYPLHPLLARPPIQDVDGSPDWTIAYIWL